MAPRDEAFIMQMAEEVVEHGRILYTPTTDWVRIMVGYAMTTARDRTKPVEVARAEGYEWFDRWLTAHDHDVAKTQQVV